MRVIFCWQVFMVGFMASVEKSIPDDGRRWLEVMIMPVPFFALEIRIPWGRSEHLGLLP